MPQATIDIYNTTRESLRPTPAKPHYTFNLRDVSKVVQGVLMADKRRAAEKEAIVRLWAHEACRVFADRLINSEDRTWLDGQARPRPWIPATRARAPCARIPHRSPRT